MFKKEDNNKADKKNAMAAGLVVGAVAGAASVILSDKDKRDKLADKAKQIKNWSDKTISDFTDKKEDVVKDASKLNVDKKEIEEKVKIAKSDLSSKVKALKDDLLN